MGMRTEMIRIVAWAEAGAKSPLRCAGRPPLVMAARGPQESTIVGIPSRAALDTYPVDE
jgi:hypothetical protein